MGPYLATRIGVNEINRLPGVEIRCKKVRIPPRTVDHLRLQPRAGTRARRPREVASPPATEANASLPRIVAIENGQRRRFRRRHQAPPAAATSLASHPRSSNPHRRARQTVPLPPRGFLLGRLSSAGPGPVAPSQRAGIRNPRMRARKSTTNCWSRRTPICQTG